MHGAFPVVFIFHSCWHPLFRAASCSSFHSVPSLDLPELHRLFSSSQFNIVLKTFIFLFLYSKLLANCKLLAFPIKWYCNQLSIFLQALFVLRFLNSEPIVVTNSSNFILTAGFSKLLRPTSIAYTPKVQLLPCWCITSLSCLPAPQCLDFPMSLPSTVA